MELHVLKQAGNKATPETLVRSIKRADAILARPIATETYLEGATAYTAAQYRAVAAANGALDLRLTPGAGAIAVLDELDAHFKQAGTDCLCLECSDITWPDELKQLLQHRGYESVKRHVYQLLRYQPAEPSPQVQVIPGRAAYGEIQQLYHAYAREQSLSDAQAKQHAAATIDQLDESRIDLFLARRQRAPVGAASLLTLGNIGVILDGFALASDATDEVWRTLSARIIDHCQRAQFEQVIVRLDDGDTRASLFEAMGFVQAATYESYRRTAR